MPLVDELILFSFRKSDMTFKKKKGERGRVRDLERERTITQHVETEDRKSATNRILAEDCTHVYVRQREMSTCRRAKTSNRQIKLSGQR